MSLRGFGSEGMCAVCVCHVLNVPEGCLRVG